MSIRFIADTSWKAVTQPEFGVNSWGTDTARVLYRGASKDKRKFEDGLDRFEVMPDYPYMFLEDWGSSIVTPSFPGVELRYVGLRKGSVPPAKPVDGVSIQTAQGSGIDTATGARVNGTFTYKASRTTWTWFETVEPGEAPRYATVRRPVDPFNNIISYQIQDDDTQKRVNTIPYSTFVAVFNSLIRRLFISDYQCEMLIPGKLWACRSEVDWKLV